MKIITSAQPLLDPEVAALRKVLRGGLTASGENSGLEIAQIVRGIITDVESRGDAALLELERKLDKAQLTASTLRVAQAELKAAHASAEPEFLALIGRVRENIRAYQQSILQRDPPPLKRGGRELSVRYLPLDRVAVYVPGGQALYPSTVLMTVVPAQVAGVKEIVLASPPSNRGDIHPLVLALTLELGVSEVYRLGGAQAVAALAIGTETVRRVDKIAGPGNAFVAEAKRQLFGRVGIDCIAGPSEVLLVADETASPVSVAADMLAQAEHNPGSALLVTTSPALARSVAQALEEQSAKLKRREAIWKALEAYSAIIVVPDLDAACAVANDFASEHLQIVTAQDEAVLAKIRHAGAIFLGTHTPVPVGDYYAGPSHVLPTGGAARFSGPLSCNDFLRASSVLRYDQTALAADAPDIIAFATREGLTAHAEAVRKRF
jgi:histidinol dehydrogenase